jgi:hypothetical protein
MLAYIGINGSTPTPGNQTPQANPDNYPSVIPGQTLTVSDPGKGVIANDYFVYGVKVLTPPTKGTLTLNADGTFTYIPNAGWSGGDSFVYQANGTGPTATVTLGTASIEAASGIVVNDIAYTSTLATNLKIASPGILSVDKDNAGYPLTVNAASVTPASGLSITVDAAGGFNASVTVPGTYSFTYKAQNSQGTVSSAAATVTLTFPTGSGLRVHVVDGLIKHCDSDYRWIIEEDRTFYRSQLPRIRHQRVVLPREESFRPGTNFHQLHADRGHRLPVAVPSRDKQLGSVVVCDIGNGVCRQGQRRTETASSQLPF